MRAIIFIMLVIKLYSCNLFEKSDEKPCPYPEATTRSHHLLIPVEVLPNQQNYIIGDTIHISAIFKDSMFDYNTKQTFLIQNFPFDPGVKLWRFENDSTWENGIRVNEILIDSIFFQRMDGGRDRVGVLFVDMLEKDNSYFFEMKIVFKKKGRYIFQFEDFIYRYTSDYYDEKIKYYTFNGQCSYGLRPIAMIQGDDHLSLFEPELLHIDKKIFYDNYRSLKYKNSFESPYGRGSMVWEFVGTYGFEVR